MEINLIYSADSKGNIEKKELKKVVKIIASKIITEEKINPKILNFVFCDDKMIRAYNKKYLGHDYETDILTFFDEDENGITEGEFLISFETVRSNSEYFETEFTNELHRVIIHGLLHLCGYDDIKPFDKKKIKKKENYYLNIINNAGKNI